jgi:hypothetical protein
LVLIEESGSYIKQYAVDCSDWELLEIVFNILNEETKGMAKGEYIPLLITFFQEIAYGRKLCLPLRLEPIGFITTQIRSKMDRSKVSFVFQSCFPGTVCFKYHLETSIISPNNKIVK